MRFAAESVPASYESKCRVLPSIFQRRDNSLADKRVGVIAVDINDETF